MTEPGGEVSHVSSFLPPFDDPAAVLARQDLIYVGGGSTANLLAVSRLHGRLMHSADLTGEWRGRSVVAAEHTIAAMTGQSVTNPTTGEVVEFVDETPEVLTMRVTWPRPGHRATEHAHPNMEETWRVLVGTASFTIDGVSVEATAGSVITAPPGRRHVAWNSGEGPAELMIEMRPGLRWAEFTSRFFAGDDPIGLLREYSDEVVLPR